MNKLTGIVLTAAVLTAVTAGPASAAPLPAAASVSVIAKTPIGLCRLFPRMCGNVPPGLTAATTR